MKQRSSWVSHCFYLSDEQWNCIFRADQQLLPWKYAIYHPYNIIYTFIPIEPKTLLEITWLILREVKIHGQTYAYNKKNLKNLIQDLAIVLFCDFAKLVSAAELKLEW